MKILSRLVSRYRVGILLTAFWVLPGTLACTTQGDYPELEQGIKVVRYMSARNQLERSSFTVVYPRGRPSEFVTWMFSTMGTAEWPPNENYLDMDAEMKDAIQSLPIPVIPKDLVLRAREPDRSSGMQVVILSDDSRGVIVVHGFVDPNIDPVLVREWKLPALGKKV